MEEPEENSDPALSDQATPTFHSYPRLPGELKLIIWKYAFAEWSSGAHRLRLFVNPIHPTRLAIEPLRKEAEDVSAWRARFRIACVDRWASKEYRLFLMKRARLLHQDEGFKQKYPGRPYFNPKEDLVTFRFDYGATMASLVMLDQVETREVFKGITRIGIEAEYFLQGFKRNKSFKPFRCMCTHPRAFRRDVCCQSLCRFLEWFPDLQEVYMIWPISKGTMNLQFHDRVPQRLPRLFVPNKRSRITQAGLDAFRRLQEIAQDNDPRGFREFHDRVGLYCEVAASSRDRWRVYDMPRYIHELKLEWDKKKAKNPEQANIAFKMLAWSDLRDVSVGQDGPLLRTRGPWR